MEGDYAEAALGGPYRLAFMRDEHLPAPAGPGEPNCAPWRHWREHLAPRGLLLIDILHPDVATLAGLDGRLES